MIRNVRKFSYENPKIGRTRRAIKISNKCIKCLKLWKLNWLTRKSRAWGWRLASQDCVADVTDAWLAAFFKLIFEDRHAARHFFMFEWWKSLRNFRVCRIFASFPRKSVDFSGIEILVSTNRTKLKAEKEINLLALLSFFVNDGFSEISGFSSIC